MKRKRLIIGVILAVALAIVPVSGALAATSQNVTVTAKPRFIAIANAPSTWVINDVADGGGKTILVNTTYYANPLGDTSAPSDPVVDGECRFTITNTSSVITNLTVNFPDHTGTGDTSTNGNTGSAGATTFGAYSYCTGMTYSSGKVIAKATGSDAMKSNLAASTDIKWGLTYSSQTNAWTSGDTMTSIVVITATAA